MTFRALRSVLVALGLACLAAPGCSQAPRPAAAIAPPPVFAVVGDTSEVLGTIPAPVLHPRPTVVNREDEGSGDAEPDSAPMSMPAPDYSYDTLRTPQPPPTDGPPPAPKGVGDATDWLVQIFAGGDRARAYLAAQRAQKVLGISEDQLSLRQSDSLWKVWIGTPSDRTTASALLARARPEFPNAFLTRASSDPGR